MDKQTMIDKIYQKIADKTLSSGCILSLYNVGHIHDYTTYYKILGNKIIKRELSFSSCSFPDNYIFVDSLTDTDEGVKKDDKNQLYIEQKKGYLLSDMWGNLVYYSHNVKQTPEEMMEKSHDLYKDISKYKIIGHPIMIGDVIHRMQQNIHVFDGNPVWYILSKIYSIPRGDFRKPIDEQTNECITFVYELIKDR